MSYLQEIDKNKEQTKVPAKKIYITFDDKLMDKYRNIEIANNEMPVALFPELVKFSPQTSEFYTAFMPSHETWILNEYRTNWLYNAYHMTPLWRWRIQEYGGRYDNETDTILWESDENEESFYSNYGYDVDEQPFKVQNKNIPSYDESQRKSLESFFSHYNTV